MNEFIEQCEALWDEFLQRWPLEKLQSMTLQEYTSAGNEDCFVYWLEARTEMLGSIWGGSAFKFGVYSRKDKTLKLTKGKLSYSDDYAWYTKYGDSPQSAFAAVLSKIIQVATAARSGDFEAIRSADLGRAFKWKVAFLYQDRKTPQLIPVYSADFLAAYLGQKSKNSIAQLQKAVGLKRGNENIFIFAKTVWEKAKDILMADVLTPEDAVAYFQEQPERFRPIKEPTKYLAGFETADGKQLAVSLRNSGAKIWLEPGAWLEDVQGQLKEIEHYPADRSRSSNLAANAPNLAEGRPAIFLTAPTRAALIALANAYDGTDINDSLLVENNMDSVVKNNLPLNQILYGPPGTGKTYATIDAALEILDCDFLSKNRDDRVALKQRYNQLAENGLIRFVTFHQSFSYEDFVEGLRASNGENGQIKYEVEDGVFKDLCDSAVARVTQKVEAPIDVTGRRIWKMSLGNAKGVDSYIYDDCIENNVALLGYGNVIDFTGVKNSDDIVQRFQAAGKPVAADAYAVAAVSMFVLKMQPGDLLIITDGNHKFRAIGEVTGDYQFIDRDDHYRQARSVRWLRVYSPSLPYQQLTKKQFSQMTLYLLKSTTIDDDKLRGLLGTADVVPTFASTAEAGSIDAAGQNTSSNARVLIIDEINRGNVSRIFGELITLIEPSKRAGAAEALEVMLPYSKDPFSVPGNVYIIGTMNTADRSLAGLDIALRRRFTFKEMPPKPELLKDVVISGVNVGELLEVMNQRIEVLLDRDHCLGHACFMSLKPTSPLSQLAAIFRNQIIPLLQEYFFEDWQRIQWVLNDHRKTAEVDRFLIQPAIDHQHLFGDGVNPSGQGVRWLINDSAFERIDAYRGIINA